MCIRCKDNIDRGLEIRIRWRDNIYKDLEVKNVKL